MERALDYFYVPPLRNIVANTLPFLNRRYFYAHFYFSTRKLSVKEQKIWSKFNVENYKCKFFVQFWVKFFLQKQQEGILPAQIEDFYNFEIISSFQSGRSVQIHSCMGAQSLWRTGRRLLERKGLHLVGHRYRFVARPFASGVRRSRRINRRGKRKQWRNHRTHSRVMGGQFYLIIIFYHDNFIVIDFQSSQISGIGSFDMYFRWEQKFIGVRKFSCGTGCL